MASNQVGILVSIGAAGLLLGFVLLGGKSCSNQVGYTAFELSGKDSIIRAIYKCRLQNLRNKIAAIKPVTKKSIPDSATREKAIAAARTDSATLLKAIFTAINDSMTFANGNADTSLAYFTRRFTIRREVLEDALANENWDTAHIAAIPLPFSHIDTPAEPGKFPLIGHDTMNLSRKPYQTRIDYFSDNPTSALWLVISIAQFTLWFLVIPLLYGMLESLRARVSGVAADTLTYKNWGISSIQPGVFFLLFTGVFYFFIIDATVIKDHYLLDGFNGKMFLYGIAGYLPTVACFGMYLLTSKAIDALAIDVQENNRTLAGDTQLKENFKALNKTFESSFMITAVILSVFVLWMGVLYHAINDTAVMRLYTAYAHRDFLSYDDVYLVAAIHSIVLLLYYVPVKAKFSSTRLSDDASTTAAINKPKILSNIYDSFTTLLITASPLLTGLVQKLLAGLIGN